MTNKEISLAIIKACKEHQELNNYCNDLFGKPITYVRGLVLGRDEFSEDRYRDVPMILIDSIQRAEGESDDKEVYTLGIQTKIEHEGEYWITTPTDNVITYKGIDEIEDINRFIVDAIRDSDDFGCLTVEDVDSYAEPVEFLSNSTEYDGYIRINFEKEKTIGCNI